MDTPAARLNKIIQDRLCIGCGLCASFAGDDAIGFGLNDDGDLGVRIITDQSKALFVPIGLLRDTEKGVWLAGLPKSASVIIRGQEYVVNGVLVDAIYEELTQ